jgi:putative acetyltransferase
MNEPGISAGSKGMIIRAEQPADTNAIGEVIEAAFGRSDEADLVDRLRTSGDCTISLIAIGGAEQIIGHVLFSTMRASFACLALAPVSVRPQNQRRGVGSALIRHGIECVRQRGWEAIFVLGYPQYYRRFGFEPAAATPFRCRYAGPNFMMLALTAEARGRAEELDYAPAFAELGV